MADSRFNQIPGYPGAVPMGPQGGGMQPHFIQATRPINPNPMMQQQMMMPFAMQSMRMAPPNTPPPPYNAHLANPAIVNLSQRPRTTLMKSKGPPKTEKERFFEEQRQKMKHFGKPGTAVVDTDSLIGAMFKPDPKPLQKGPKGHHKAENMGMCDDDDGFGDFLQGPSVESKPSEPENLPDVNPAVSPEPATLTVEEKKDLNSMMLECSDLSAPQKAKGFHKPTLNEVHRPGHENARRASFHESDHSRSWKHAEDLDGLFQIPVQPPVVPVQTAVAYAGPVPQGPMPGQPVPAVMHPGAVPMMRPTGPPPAYSDALNHPSSPVLVMPANAVFGQETQNINPETGHVFNTPTSYPMPQSPPAQGHTGPSNFPEWCSLDENNLPPLYKQVLDASIVEGQISTERLYPILLLSGLPREKLAHIWSICNNATPGQLIKSELWLILALIGLAQNNIDTTKLEILKQCPIPPVPVLVTPQNGTSPSVATSIPNGVSAITPSASPGSVPSPIPSPAAPTPVSPAPQQSFNVQSHPKVPYQAASSPSLSLSSAAVSITSAEDDFSDFQAAPSPSNQAEVAGKISPAAVLPDESYGEFIGGGISNTLACGGVSSRESAFQPCVPFPAQTMGNGVLGHGHSRLLYPHHHHPHHPCPPAPAYEETVSHYHDYFHQGQLAVESDCPCRHSAAYQLSDPLPLSMRRAATLPPANVTDAPPPPPNPVEDKYTTNVRSFFCSSDSSTGHTSPSFEDDDFTDGRDSLSQISTSEQSENDDIRNFESYVEEFNHKTKAPTGSPLHCPFPSVQQGNSVPKHGKGTNGPLSGHSFPSLSQPDQNGPPRSEANFHANTPTSGSMTSSAFGKLEMPNKSQPKAFPPAPSLFPPSQAPSSDVSSEEFADFKSAQLSVPSVSSMTASAVSLVSTSAYNSRSGDDFDDFKSASIPPPGLSNQQQQQREQRESSSRSEDDKYGALRTIEEDDLMTSSVFESAALSSSFNSGTGTAGENEQGEDEEWANFEEAPPANDEVDLFSSAGSAQSSNHDASLTSSQSQSSNTKDDILKLFAAGTASKAAAMTSSTISEGSASMVNSDSGYSTKSSFFDTTPTSTGHPELGDKDSASVWSQSMTAATPGSESSNNWADFSGSEMIHNTGTPENTLGPKPTVNISSHTEVVSELGQFSSPDKGATVEDDWGDFTQTSASSSSIFPPENNSGSMSSTSDDSSNWANFAGAAEGGSSEANMVTIKKQNLGTNEIMGVFKVRNDPATLSTYQLPPKTPHHTGASRPRKSSSGPNRNLSSDVDDDMVPPPMDSEGEDGDDDGYTFSRGYDLDDYMQRQTPVTTYSPFGTTNTSPYFSRAGKSLVAKVAGSNEDSGSVNSLELPSAKPYDSATNDSHSVSSSDMNSGVEASNVSGVWKSMESLDFPSDTVDTNDEADKDDNSSETHTHGPIQPQELLNSMPRLADKYNIDGEAQGNDRYRHEWERCLTNCCQILTEANTLFNNISSSAVCNEVLKASEGSDFVSCVIEIYRVGCRVMAAMSSTAISSSELEQTLKQIDLVWNNLSAFLVGASLLPDPASLIFDDAIVKSGSEGASQSSACGLCLLNVEYCPPTSSSTQSVSLSSTSVLSSLSRSESVSRGITGKLTFAGRQYHSTCANFWVNCVDQTLPSLDLPELL